VWALKGSQVLARRARFNRRQLHWRVTSRALRPVVLLVEHRTASIRRSEFSGKPTGCIRSEGIGCDDVDLNVIAFGAFEQPVFEADWPGRNALQHHSRLAARTVRALNSGQ
jgi:hypothetical protein